MSTTILRKLLVVFHRYRPHDSLDIPLKPSSSLAPSPEMPVAVVSTLNPKPPAPPQVKKTAEPLLPVVYIKQLVEGTRVLSVTTPETSEDLEPGLEILPREPVVTICNHIMDKKTLLNHAQAYKQQVKYTRFECRFHLHSFRV